jgi:type III restriction enzyme
MNHLNDLSARLSLRPPQRRSLEILSEITDLVHFDKLTEPVAALAAIQAAYPQVADFEREFPSLCFALATGVGKTRLMGAFIAYLHLAHKIYNFFVLAPNLTIYNKLLQDFTPNTSKYVFKGIADFANEPPEIITSDNYETGRGVRKELFDAGVHINIFNISRINSEVRGGKSPRIKRLHEYIGQSYFDYLAGLSDLVLLMDESHRYRGSAGVRALNELRPILGLELTATPQVESGSRTTPFKNVIYSYPLAQAMIDGFVKEPAVATREGFKASDYTPDKLERLKLEDGVRIHENSKVELEIYARRNDRPLVKPFMMVVARDTDHAEAIVAEIKKDDFFEGRYKDRVITVHSNQKGEEKDETVAQLLSVEAPDNPTEIVVHVNMLKEGWDVTNLYTIVPLRAADSRTLVEQSIGRGLRLPYGARVGVSAVDRLTIVAHDRFEAIIAEAKQPGSSINWQQVVIGADVPLAPKEIRTVLSTLEEAIAPTAPVPTVAPSTAAAPPSLFSADEAVIAHATLEFLKQYESRPKRVPHVSALKSPEIQAEIAAKVAAALAPVQPALPGVMEQPDVPAVVARIIDLFVDRTINLPRIVVVPVGEVTTGYTDFDLSPPSFAPQAVSHEILLQYLRTQERELLSGQVVVVKEQRPENYLVSALMDFDDIDYEDNSDLLYKLAGQMVAHLRSYLTDEPAVENVLQYHRKHLAAVIQAQMQAHRWERATRYEVEISRGFEAPRPLPFSAVQGEAVRDVRQTVKHKQEIPRLLFGGFRRCVYPVQQFSTDQERLFAVMLEDEPGQPHLKWFKPVKGQFKIFYRSGEGYEPDFVVETAESKYLCEPKRASEIDDATVQDKARAAVQWCQYATAHERAYNGKPWSYLLIPHDAINVSATLRSLAALYTYRDDNNASRLLGTPMS